jgi:hypothetical protein
MGAEIGSAGGFYQSVRALLLCAKKRAAGAALTLPGARDTVLAHCRRPVAQEEEQSIRRTPRRAS